MQCATSIAQCSAVRSVTNLCRLFLLGTFGLATSGASAGCSPLCFSQFWNYSTAPVISPDNSRVAFIYSWFTGDKFDFQLRAELYLEDKGGTGEIRLCSPETPPICESIKPPAIEHAVPIPTQLGFLDEMLISLLKFSPDSNYLAILSRGVLSCIELSTKRHWVLIPSDERVSTFEWSDEHTLGYVSYGDRRRVFLQRIDEPIASRRMVHDAGPVSEPTYYPSERWTPRERAYEHWSANGSFMIYRNDDGDTKLVEVRTGEVIWEGAVQGKELQSCWKRDESAVVCIGSEQAIGHPVVLRAVFLHTDPVRMIDITDPLIRLVQGSGNVADDSREDIFHTFHSLRLEPWWTSDGKYLLLNCFPRVCHLVSLDPWKVVTIGIDPRLSRLPRRRHDPFPWSSPVPSTPTIRWLPVPGWVKLEMYGLQYAIDYSHERIVRITSHNGWGLDTVVSPNGRFSADIPERDRLTVRPLDLSKARPIREFVQP